jgi:hypothetical protein
LISRTCNDDRDLEGSPVVAVYTSIIKINNIFQWLYIALEKSVKLENTLIVFTSFGGG